MGRILRSKSIGKSESSMMVVVRWLGLLWCPHFIVGSSDLFIV